MEEGASGSAKGPEHADANASGRATPASVPDRQNDVDDSTKDRAQPIIPRSQLESELTDLREQLQRRSLDSRMARNFRPDWALLTENINKVVRERDALRESLAAVLSSTAWRATAGLRALVILLRQLKHQLLHRSPIGSAAAKGDSESWEAQSAREPERLAQELDPHSSLRFISAIVALFDADWYCLHYPDVVTSGLDSLPHYLEIGFSRGRDPSPLFDSAWYLANNPDLASHATHPVLHYINHGGFEGRDPNRLFASSWYLSQNPDVAALGENPLLHYVMVGASEDRDPHPNFDSHFYCEAFPEARGARNPLMHYLTAGQADGLPTEYRPRASEYLPAPPRPGDELDVARLVEIIIPVYRGLEDTQRCLLSVLHCANEIRSRVTVVDDCSPDVELSAWLRRLAEQGAIHLVRNETNIGFVASVNRAMSAALPGHDIVLLNSDTEVAPGWLDRFVRQACSRPNVGTVTPFSNNATICSYPTLTPGALPPGETTRSMDLACQQANRGRSVKIPTAVGFCMYIRRDCLEDVGLFDAERFGLGYGEENDFCMRASARGWRHLHACDIFVYHVGQVSFGAHSPSRDRAASVLVARHPEFPKLVSRHVRQDRAAPYRFAVTAALWRQAGPEVTLVLDQRWQTNHHPAPDAARSDGEARLLLLQSKGDDFWLTVPGIAEHPAFVAPCEEPHSLAAVIKSFEPTAARIFDWLGHRPQVESLLELLETRVDDLSDANCHD